MSVIKKYLHHIDLVRNKLMNPLLNPMTSVERTALGASLTAADEGYTTFDTTLNNIYFWTGSTWIAPSGGGGSAVWGGITGTLTAQTDLINYLATTYTPLNRNITINGITQDLSVDRTWTISGSGTLVALPFTTDHLATTNNEYVIGDLVYYSGNVYRCIANNDSLQPDIAPAYWTSLGAGYPLVQQPVDWNSTSGNNQILNKPTIPTGTVTSVATSAPITGGTITSTGTIGITQAGAASDGYLSSGDWTTFNNKVGGSGNTNYVPKFSNTGTPATIGDSQIFDNGTSVGIGTALPDPLYRLQTLGAIATNSGINIDSNVGTKTGFYSSVNGFTIWAGNNNLGTYRLNGNIVGSYFEHTAGFSNSGAVLTGSQNTWRLSASVTATIAPNAIDITQLLIDPTYNQGTFGTGILRGVYYNPTVSVLNGSQHIAWQNTSGDIIHGNLATGGVAQMVTADTNGKLGIQTIPSGTITNVTATSPITSSGGNTPDISTSMATNKLIGRSTAGVGVMEEITVGTGLSLSAGTLSSTVTGGIPHGIAAGTDTYTVTIAGVTSYAEGDAYIVRFTNGNTTSCTLNINGIGAVPLYRNNDGVLIGGDIIDNGDMLCVYDVSIPAFRVIGTAPNTLLGYVTNADSVPITRGQVVYAFGGTGDRMTVKLANNVGDTTSAQTVGLVVSTSIAANQKGLIMIQGLLDELSILPTATWNDGDPVYLGAIPGSITNVKPYAPAHLVYIGIVTTASNGSAGRMYVKIQNGYELDELHNVQAQSPSLKDTLWYDNTVTPAQWKTASISTILGYTPVGPDDTDYEYLMMSSLRTTYNY